MTTNHRMASDFFLEARYERTEQERTTKRKTDFSHSSRQCFERLRCKLELRFDRKQRNVDLSLRDEMDAFLAMDPEQNLGKKTNGVIICVRSKSSTMNSRDNERWPRR